VFQPDDASGAVFEPSQAWEVGLLAASEAEEDLMDHAIQAVRGFGLGHTGPASHPFCDIGLIHSGFTVAGELWERPRQEIPRCRQADENR